MFSRLVDQQFLSSLCQAIRSVFPPGFSPCIRLTPNQGSMFASAESSHSSPGEVYSVDGFVRKIHQDFLAYQKAEENISEALTSMKMTFSREIDRLKESFFVTNGKLVSLREAGTFFSDFKNGKFFLEEETTGHMEPGSPMICENERQGEFDSNKIMSILKGNGSMLSGDQLTHSSGLISALRKDIQGPSREKNQQIHKEKLVFALKKLISAYAINEKVLNSSLDLDELKNTLDQAQLKISKLVNGITPKLKEQKSLVECPDKPVSKVHLPIYLETVSLGEEGSICTKEGGLVLLGYSLWVLNEHGSLGLFECTGKKGSFEKVWQKKLPLGAPSDECMLGLSPSGARLFVTGFSNKMIYILDSMSGSLTNSFAGPLSASQSTNNYLSCATFLNEYSIVGVYSSETVSTMALFNTKGSPGSGGSQPSMMTSLPSLEGGVSCISRGDSATVFLGFVSGIIGMFCLAQQQFIWASDSAFSNSITSLRLFSECLVAVGFAKKVEFLNSYNGEPMAPAFSSGISGDVFSVDLTQSNLLLVSGNEVVLMRRGSGGKFTQSSMSVVKRQPSFDDDGYLVGGKCNWKEKFAVVGTTSGKVHLLKLT